MTHEAIAKATKYLIDNWGESGKNVIAESQKVCKAGMTSDEFSKHCICCGGNFCAMILSGIRELWPHVWEVIPSDMGEYAFECLVYTVRLCRSEKGC